MSVEKFLTVVLGFYLAMLHHELWAQQSESAVSGHVTVWATDYPQPVKGARVSLTRGGQELAAAISNGLGEFSVVLPGSGRYEIMVTLRGFCTLHRPPFETGSGQSVRFTFSMVSCGDVDSFQLNSSGLQPTYREESIAQGVVVGFGHSKEDTSTTVYFPISPRRYPEVQIPVVVSFGTHTIRGKSAVLGHLTKLLRVEGQVTIEDGSDLPSRKEQCVLIHLENPTTTSSCP
jgi:hypothetical protein